MMSTKELCSSYVSTLLPGPHVKEEAEILEYISESDDITSEIKYFRLGFGLGIPYHLVLQNLRDAASIDSVTTHPSLMKTHGNPNKVANGQREGILQSPHSTVAEREDGPSFLNRTGRESADSGTFQQDGEGGHQALHDSHD